MLGALFYLLILIVIIISVNGTVESKKVVASVIMGALSHLIVLIFRTNDRTESATNVKEVFICFRGRDTRRNFIPHLHAVLEKERISAFVDDYEISVGENIEEAIVRAINESKLSVIVFSRNFASSSWCLDELAMIMKRRRTSRHIVLPVFYHVDPADIRKQTGTYGQAIAKYERQFSVQEWRKTVKEAAGLKGMVLKAKCEAQFIQDVVEEIRKKLNH